MWIDKGLFWFLIGSFVGTAICYIVTLGLLGAVWYKSRVGGGGSPEDIERRKIKRKQIKEAVGDLTLEAIQTARIKLAAVRRRDTENVGSGVGVSGSEESDRENKEQFKS